MKIRQTSILAYSDITETGVSGVQRGKIFRFLRYQYPLPFSRNDISRRLKIPINAVCGRVNELIKDKRVEEIGKKKDPITKKLNMLFRYVS